MIALDREWIRIDHWAPRYTSLTIILLSVAFAMEMRLPFTVTRETW